MNNLVRCAAAAIALSLLAAGVQAQSKYPTKPIRLLTPFAAGGGSDILARLIGPPLTEVLGQPVVVDNRPGGGGTLGAGIAARADPDAGMPGSDLRNVLIRKNKALNTTGIKRLEPYF